MPLLYNYNYIYVLSTILWIGILWAYLNITIPKFFRVAELRSKSITIIRWRRWGLGQKNFQMQRMKNRYGADGMTYDSIMDTAIGKIEINIRGNNKKWSN